MSTTDGAAVGEVSRVPEGGGEELCAACGYALQGLPAAGTCPECGHAYADDVIVLYGYARGGQADASTARPRSLIWFGLLAFVNVLIMLPTLSGHHVATAIMGLSFGVAFVVALWLRRNQSHPGTVQARFNRLGCVQHANAVDPGVRVITYIVFGCLGLFWLVAFAREADVGAVVGLGITAAICGLIYVHHRLRRRRAERAGLLTGLTDDLHRAVPTAWGETGQATIERTGDGGSFRLRVERCGRVTTTAVDIEVRMPDERMNGFLQRISAWKEAAGGEA